MWGTLINPSSWFLDAFAGHFMILKMLGPTIKIKVLQSMLFCSLDHAFSYDEQKTKRCITHSMYWCLIYCYMFRHFKMLSSGSPIWTYWYGAQCRKNQIMMGAVYCDRWRNGRAIQTITPSVTIYSSHPSLLFTTLGTISARSIGLPDDGILKCRNM
jgi:hypothetical protein